MHITNELFRFIVGRQEVDGTLVHEIEIGTRTKPIGRIQFKARAAYAVPKSIVLRRTGSGGWWVSWSFEQAAAEELRDGHELAYEFNQLSDTELARICLALDRNVADNCLGDSTGAFYDLKPIERSRLTRKEVRRKSYQRKMARQERGSKNREKTKRSVSMCSRRGAGQ